MSWETDISTGGISDAILLGRPHPVRTADPPRNEFIYLIGSAQHLVIFDYAWEFGAIREQIEPPLLKAQISIGVKLLAVAGETEIVEAIPDAHPWFRKALRLESSGEPARALDLVYQTIDAWLRSGQFQRCDAFLSDVDVENAPPRLLLAILTVTYAASRELPNREPFFDRVWTRFINTGKDAPKLLNRLRAQHVPPAKHPRHINRFT